MVVGWLCCSGVKTWQLRYYKPGTSKRTTLTLGNYPDLSPAGAREQREQAKGLLAKGIDPQSHKQQQIEADELRRGNTFQKVAADWYEMKKSQNLAPNTIKDIWRSLEKYVGNRPINEITARIFVTTLEPIKARGNLETLTRVLQEPV